jgi:hypothetical protein
MMSVEDRVVQIRSAENPKVQARNRYDFEEHDVHLQNISSIKIQASKALQELPSRVDLLTFDLKEDKLVNLTS